MLSEYVIQGQLECMRMYVNVKVYTIVHVRAGTRSAFHECQSKNVHYFLYIYMSISKNNVYRMSCCYTFGNGMLIKQWSIISSLLSFHCQPLKITADEAAPFKGP